MPLGRRDRSTTGYPFLAGALCLAGIQTTQAAGFALIEQTVPDMGTAYAGAAARAGSADTLYFNPAGMTRLPGTRAAAAVHLVKPKTEFDNEGTSYVNTLPISGGDGGDAGGLATIPHFYLTHALSAKTWFGLAVNVPFGLATEYDSDWVGRYHAIKSEVKTININPSLAYKVNEQLSVALGVSAMYLEGEFTQAVDWGLLSGALPGSNDGKAEIEGDAWGWGFNVGALFEPSPGSRIGVHFRSEVEQDIEGDIDYSNVPVALQPVFFDTGAEADVDLPATVSISGFHQLNREWAIVGDYTWTGWSSIPELRFDFDASGPAASSTVTFDWQDTSRVALGAIHTPNGSDWSYRFGAAYDESPIRNAETRSARLPDNDRIWVTVGAGYNPGKNLRIDFGYAHLFIDDAKIRKTATGEDLARGALKGTYESSSNILAVEAEYLFD
jgi:long-chain fatty acid transport protein